MVMKRCKEFLDPYYSQDDDKYQLDGIKKTQLLDPSEPNTVNKNEDSIISKIDEGFANLVLKYKDNTSNDYDD